MRNEKREWKGVVTRPGRIPLFSTVNEFNIVFKFNLGGGGGVVKYNNVHEFMTVRKTCFLISQFKIVVN